jgi:CubicO group peptidase (beta-lactamase class C family)
MIPRTIILLSLALSIGCQKSLPPEKEHPNEPYFPPAGSPEWETTPPEEMGWNLQNLEALYTYLASNSTRAFIVLINGKMAVEKYWGHNIAGTAPFDQNTNWYWASAGKTITAFLVGLAQEENYLSLQDRTSDHLGNNWTGMPSEKEDLITIWHHLTMTTGLDYDIPDLDCTDPVCLQYNIDAGEQWFYHNAPYTLLGDMIAAASGDTYNQFTDEKLEEPIGMSGTWVQSGYNRVYWSTPRDAARFGLMILSKGKWASDRLMMDTSYFNAMVTTSQELNPSYGYLWWLNGKTSTIFPGLATPISISIAPNAPADLIAAMGKNGQFIDVVPSLNLVVVRMGEAPEGSTVPIQFHDQMWQILKTVFD